MSLRKWILTCAAAVLVIGLALCYVGYTSSAGEKQVAYEQQEYTAAAEGIGTLLLKARDMSVTVTAGKGDQIVLHYYTAEEDPYDVTLENGVLTLKCRYENSVFSNSPSSWFNFGWFTVSNIINRQDLKIEVEVPAEYAGLITVDTSNAPVAVSGFHAVQTVRVDTSNGPVRLEDITASSAYASTSNGSVTLSSIQVSGGMEASASNGPISAKNVSCGGALRLGTSNGPITVEEVLGESVELSTSNGPVSGSVKGTLDGYTVSASTSNGSSSLTSGGSGPRKLTVVTSNGQINVRFSGE